MALELKLPALGENIDSGDVVKLLVAVGDTVRKDDPVLELETGKATVEVPAAEGGKVSALHVQVGQTVKVGERLLTLEQTGTAVPAAVAGPAAVPAAKTGGTRITRTAAPVQAPAARTTRTLAPVQAPATRITRTVAPAQAPVEPPPRVEPPPADGALPAPPASPPPAASARERAPIMAAPSVRQFAREIGVDVYAVPGSGPGGRVSVEDVKQHARGRNTASLPAPAAGPVTSGPLPDFTKFGPVTREPMSTVRQLTAQQMSLAWALAPMVTHYDQADITDLERARKQFAPRAEQAGAKLTLTAILVKVVAAALKAHPKFNASVDMARREIVLKHYIHVGVAVDTDRGLLVPVIRDADRKDVLQLARELADAAGKARDRKLKPDDLQGGNFTVSNLGGLGAKHFAPIVNYPELAILGVGRAGTEPVYVDGELRPRLMLPLALTYDHRVIDGADAARFLRWIVEALEQPFRLWLEA